MDSENRKTDCFKSSFIYLISHNDRSGSKRTGTDSRNAKLVVSRPVFIICIFLKIETDRNGLQNCKTCRFKASFYHQHNHNDRNVQKIAKQQTVSSPVLSIKLTITIGTGRNGPERTQKLQNLPFQGQFLSLTYSGTDSKIAKHAVSRPAFIIIITITTGTDRKVPERNQKIAKQTASEYILLNGSGTFRAKTSSSRDGSRKKYFSNGTFPPGTVRAFFQKMVSRF